MFPPDASYLAISKLFSLYDLMCSLIFIFVPRSFISRLKWGCGVASTSNWASWLNALFISFPRDWWPCRRPCSCVQGKKIDFECNPAAAGSEISNSDVLGLKIIFAVFGRDSKAALDPGLSLWNIRMFIYVQLNEELTAGRADAPPAFNFILSLRVSLLSLWRTLWLYELAFFWLWHLSVWRAAAVTNLMLSGCGFYSTNTFWILFK